MISNEPKLIETNILNSVEVLRKTYGELKKLMTLINEKALEKGFDLLTPEDDFLYWFNYRNPSSWVLSHFVKVFQQKTDGNTLFTVELNLEDFEYGRPSVVLGCHVYDQSPQLDRGVGGSWRFNQRYWNSDHYHLKEEDDFIHASLKQKEVTTRVGKYGFRSACFKKLPLFILTQSNLDQHIFEVLTVLKMKSTTYIGLPE